MVRLTRIYTRLGDGGETHLGDMSRTSKASARVHAFGEVDEANSAIGVALTHELPEAIAAKLTHIQNDLFDLGADLCVPDGAEGERWAVEFSSDGLSGEFVARQKLPLEPHMLVLLRKLA